MCQVRCGFYNFVKLSRKGKVCLVSHVTYNIELVSEGRILIIKSEFLISDAGPLN